MRADRHQRGFTLIEVLVALIIAGALLPTLLIGFANQADGIAYLRDKSVAQWVASNKLAETRIEVLRSQQIFSGIRSGSTEMAQRQWFWWVESQATEVEGFYKVEVRVAEAEDEQDSPIFTLVGFLAAHSSAEGNDG